MRANIRTSPAFEKTSDSRCHSKCLCNNFGNLCCHLITTLHSLQLLLHFLHWSYTSTALFSAHFNVLLQKESSEIAGLYYTFSPLIVRTSSLESKNIAGPGRPGRPRRPFSPISPSAPFCPLAVKTEENISLVLRRSLLLRFPREAWKEWTSARVFC